MGLQTRLAPLKRDYLGMFSGLVEATFLGRTYRLGDNNYVLKPVILGKYDVLRSISSPGTEFERLLRDLPQEFKSVARSELYRKSTGWITRGEQARRLKEIEIQGKPFVVPFLGKPSVGIDTSSDSEWTYICVACFDDAESGYAYFEKHLGLPKAKDPTEFKWMKLSADYRKNVIENLPTLFEISCKAVLVIKTNALTSREEKLVDVFIKLVAGSFSGYERMQGELRARLKDGFFSMTNETPIHCDADFSPLTSDKVARQLVRTLAGGKPFVPLHAGLKSEESHPIQVADVICGAAKSLIQRGRQSEVGLTQIPFDNKLKGKEKTAKAYYWVNRKNDPGAESR